MEAGKGPGQHTHPRIALTCQSPSQSRHAAVAARLRTSTSAADFFDELASLLADDGGAVAASTSGAAPALAAADRAAAVLASLPDGWLGRVTRVSDDGSVLTVAVPDGVGTDRAVTLTLPPAWPAAAPILGGDAPPLPSAVVWHPGTSLGALLDGVAAAFEAAAPVATLLADIDAACRVLDPPPPAPAAATWRRLALAGGKASVEVAFDAAAGAAAKPTLAFLGPPALVDGPRAAAAAAPWRPELGGAAALEALLGVSLERKPIAVADDAPTTTTTTTDAECAVCYAYRLDGGPPPSIACPNARCGRPFHAACLRGWLAQTAAGGGGGGALHGACPYCGDGMTLDA